MTAQVSPMTAEAEAEVRQWHSISHDASACRVCAILATIDALRTEVALTARHIDTIFASNTILHKARLDADAACRAAIEECDALRARAALGDAK